MIIFGISPFVPDGCQGSNTISLQVRLSALGSENRGLPAKFEFQSNKYFLVEIRPKYLMRYTYTKKKIILIYLNFKWSIFCISSNNLNHMLLPSS